MSLILFWEFRNMPYCYPHRLGSYPVISSDGNYLFSIKYNPIMSDPGRLCRVHSRIVFSRFFILLINSISMHLQWLLKSIRVFYHYLLVFIKWLMLDISFSWFLYGMPLFNPKFYATSYFLNSLGDFYSSASVFVVSFCLFITICIKKEK